MWKYKEEGGDVSNCLTTVQKDSLVYEPITTRGKDIANALRATIHKNGERNIIKNIVDGSGYEGIIEPNYRIRKLTPKECFRLMNFDDIDYERASAVNSRSQLYKQAGNSIVVACLEKIFKQLL